MKGKLDRDDYREVYSRGHEQLAEEAWSKCATAYRKGNEKKSQEIKEAFSKFADNKISADELKEKINE